MLKMLLTATRSFLKKTCAAAVTFAVKAVNGLVKLLTRAKDTAIEGWSWLNTKLRKPSPILHTKNTGGKSSPSGSLTTGTIWTMAAATVKAIAMQRFLLFLGGLICCFILPDEAKGDLTWFENMLTSSRDFFSNTAKAGVKKITSSITGLYSTKGGDLINSC
jgi:hypothetical protein